MPCLVGDVAATFQSSVVKYNFILSICQYVTVILLVDSIKNFICTNMLSMMIYNVVVKKKYNN